MLVMFCNTDNRLAIPEARELLRFVAAWHSFEDEPKQVAQEAGGDTVVCDMEPIHFELRCRKPWSPKHRTPSVAFA